jgi:hypothetical protein
LSRTLPRATFAAAAAAVVLAGAATPALAAKPAAKPVAKKAAPAPKPRPARYVVVGTLSAVDGTSLTLAPTTGGNAKVRPAPVTVTVADGATVVRDDAPATLADLVAGDHVAASGTRTGTAVTITKVVVTSPQPAPEPEPTA